MNQGRKMCNAGLAAAAFLAFGGQAIAAEQLLGSWCDDTGYRIDLSADRISFRDRQYGDPPDGSELAFGDGIAVYRQDFRHTRWPQIDVLDCTLRLTAPDGAEETCRGPGYGYVPQFNLKRCPADVIS
jgi:hypothetical protein